MRYQGTITTWKDGKGFGFITPNGGGNQIFVQITSFANRQRRPVGNEIVTYELGTDANGRIRAKRVSFSDESLPSTYSHVYNIGLLM
ncbi:MAG: cold shock domain-containing protein, partial [Desulfobacterales bacterium]